MSAGNEPVATVSVPSGQGGQIVASVWENDVQGKDYKTYSITLQRRYRDDDGWKSATGFRPSDLLAVAYVAQKAYEKTLEVRNSNK